MTRVSSGHKVNWREVTKLCALATLCLTVFVVGLTLAINLTTGPPPTCGSGTGLRQVIPNAKDSNGDVHPLVVCNNGRSFWP